MRPQRLQYAEYQIVFMALNLHYYLLDINKIRVTLSLMERN